MRMTWVVEFGIWAYMTYGIPINLVESDPHLLCNDENLFLEKLTMASCSLCL
jgi:hypothetical protein